MKRFALMMLALLLVPFVASAQMSDNQIVEYVQAGMRAGRSQTQIGAELMARGVTREQVERLRDQMERSESGTGTSSLDRSVIIRDDIIPEPEHDQRGASTSQIFGHSIFTQRALTFEPNNNAATPQNYTLGPGDEIVIDIWGLNEANIRQTISPEGYITISQIGPVQLSGLTIKQASEKIRKALRSKYASLGGSQSSVSVTLGKVRTIQVNVLGEVNTPGTYRLSSFSTVLNAIYRAGGVNDRGSMRNIKVVRAGEELPPVDVYGYLFNGSSDSDINLAEGDIIIVPTYSRIVKIDGKVKRPMYYELSDGETLADLISYAGDFASDAYRSDLRVMRQSGPEKEVFTVSDASYASFMLDDGDVVEIGSAIDRYSNMVEVRGSIFRPGIYQIGGEISSVKQLVERAGGLTEDAFAGRAVIVREKEDLSLESVSFNLGMVLSGMAVDVPLRRNDVLIVSSIKDVEDRGNLTINGLVQNPGTFTFSDNTTVEDLILMAGGLLEGASTARVDVFRRRMDAGATTYSDVLGQSFSFPMHEGLVLDGGDRFVLEPYDIVSVRRSPGYRGSRSVQLTGEVLYPGYYLLQRDNETISDLIARAGGLTPSAYAKGSTVTRRNKFDKEVANNFANVASRIEEDGDENMKSSADLVKQFTEENYNIAINLQQALNNAHGNADIVLKDGDVITVPAYKNEVRVIGEVMMPVSVSYTAGGTLSSYVRKAGGYTKKAQRRNAYVIYPNGAAAKGALAGVEPGSTIVVPAKSERKGLSVGEVTAVASASTSIVSAVALIANIVLNSKK